MNERDIFTLTWYGPSTSHPQKRKPRYRMPAQARNRITLGMARFSVSTRI